MSCERYVGSLTDAALGVPASPELEEHLRGCGACRGRLDLDRCSGALVDRVLGDTLRVEPSPDLAWRVRRRLAQPAASPGHARVWWAVAAAAGLTAAAVAYRAHTDAKPTAPQVLARGPAAPPAVPSVTPAGQAASPIPAGPRPGRTPSPPPRRPAVTPEPEVIVPAGQLEALPRFLQALRARGARPPVVPAVTPGPAMADTGPAGIDVPSIEFPPIDRRADAGLEGEWPPSDKE